MNPDQLCERQPEAAALLEEHSIPQGYEHTLREILQQPATWMDTCARLIERREDLYRTLMGISALVLSGSGSSQFAGECVRPVLQNDLAIAVQTVGGGVLLTHGPAAMPPGRPALLVSLARSGDSPESVGVVSAMLGAELDVRHLVITCNGEGGLAQAYKTDERVETVVLDPRTNDRSLVMTSSFTNLVLAARFLGVAGDPDRYRSICCTLSRICVDLFMRHFGTLARVGRLRFPRVAYLESGPDRGVARECSLKMLEMTAGEVATLPETYLGLRHGPMSFIDESTLVVCFVSSKPHLREYELDLIRELNRKKLGGMKLLVGECIDRNLLMNEDKAIEMPGWEQAGDENTAVLQVVIGQLLAFFRCMAEGLKPDSPSENGVISRVVEEFPIYPRAIEGKR